MRLPPPARGKVVRYTLTFPSITHPGYFGKLPHDLMDRNRWSCPRMHMLITFLPVYGQIESYREAYKHFLVIRRLSPFCRELSRDGHSGVCTCQNSTRRRVTHPGAGYRGSRVVTYVRAFDLESIGTVQCRDVDIDKRERLRSENYICRSCGRAEFGRLAQDNVGKAVVINILPRIKYACCL